MKSVADALREDTVRRTLALSPGERVALALRLGREAVRRYAEAHRLDLPEAQRILARNRRAGRVHSGAIEALDE